MSLEWSDEYTVEHDKMDEQHQKLFDIINEYYAAVEAEAPFVTLVEVFDKVVKFADFHFKEEEMLMERYNFPKIREHKIIHKNLVERVLELKEDLKAEKEGSRDMVKYFLKNWLTSHIKGIDKQYSPFVNELKAKAG